MNNIKDYLKEQEVNIKNNGTKKFKIKLLIIVTFLFVFSILGFLHITQQIFNGISGLDTITVSRQQLKQLITKERQELKQINKDEQANSKLREEIKEIGRINKKRLL